MLRMWLMRKMRKRKRMALIRRRRKSKKEEEEEEGEEEGLVNDGHIKAFITSPHHHNALLHKVACGRTTFT